MSIITSAAIAAGIAEGIKRSITQGYHGTGMPSGHAAALTAMLAVVFFTRGWQSDLFQMLLVAVVIVLGDLALVRRVGVVTRGGYAIGHSTPELIAGALIGVIVGAAVAKFTT